MDFRGFQWICKRSLQQLCGAEAEAAGTQVLVALCVFSIGGRRDVEWQITGPYILAGQKSRDHRKSIKQSI